MFCLTICLRMKSGTMFHFLHKHFWKDFRKREVNWEPLSEMMDKRSPWRFTISLIYILAYSSSVYVDLTWIKWAYLVNLSTITHIDSFWFRVRGNPTKNSILLSSHFDVRISMIWVNPSNLRFSALTYWKFGHLATNLVCPSLKHTTITPL